MYIVAVFAAVASVTAVTVVVVVVMGVPLVSLWAVLSEGWVPPFEFELFLRKKKKKFTQTLFAQTAFWRDISAHSLNYMACNNNNNGCSLNREAEMQVGGHLDREREFL